MFNLKRVNNASVIAPSIKQIAANTSVSYAVGDALVITSGKAAKAGATAVPEYICAEKASGKDEISAYLVEPNMEFETTLSTAGTLTVGSKVTLHTDSAQVTATTTSGVAEVVSAAGSAQGDVVVVKF